VSLNRARSEQPTSEVAASAVLIGQAKLCAGALLAQGVVLRSRAGAVALGNHSAVLENGVLVGWPGQPVEIGQRTVSATAPPSSAPASVTCARSATGPS
jgi:carbonic anhydrase/acetyltransferase-like protein (isoleucine patch superfamily)